VKIEIGLNDIFRDDEGPDESLEESVRRQVFLDKLSGDLRKRLFERLDRIERQQADFNAALDRGQAALDRAAEAIARAEHLLGETA
jgi:hypothetical protein